MSRKVAGFAWKWKTKNMKIEDIKSKNLYDIEIEGNKYIWNTTAGDWVYSANSINEVGCVHKVLGYDLNYAGVIIGPDLKYDKKKNKVIIDKKNYYDYRGKDCIKSDQGLFKFISYMIYLRYFGHLCICM